MRGHSKILKESLPDNGSFGFRSRERKVKVVSFCKPREMVKGCFRNCKAIFLMNEAFLVVEWRNTRCSLFSDDKNIDRLNLGPSRVLGLPVLSFIRPFLPLPYNYKLTLKIYYTSLSKYPSLRGRYTDPSGWFKNRTTGPTFSRAG